MTNVNEFIKFMNSAKLQTISNPKKVYKDGRQATTVTIDGGDGNRYFLNHIMAHDEFGQEVGWVWVKGQAMQQILEVPTLI